MMKSTLRVIPMLAVLALAPGAILAQEVGEFSIVAFTIDGGGGTSEGGDFSVTGTIGQPDVGPESSGGEFALAGGIWAGIEVVNTPGTPQLGVSRDPASNTVTVFWPLPDDGFVLRESPSLGLAPTPWVIVPPFSYQTDGTFRFITIVNPTGQNYYRLFPVAP